MPQRFTITKREPIMNNTRFLYLFLVFLATFFIFLKADNQQALTDLYRTGKIRFIPELTLDDSSMPDGVFFESPFNITGDPDGNVYICDYRANNIKKFNASGKFIKIIGREGQGPGEFNWPSLATFAKDRLIVWDMRNRRICALTPEGEFITAIKISFEVGRPLKMRSLPNGDIVIENERSFFGESDKPQECTIEIFSSDLKHKKTIYSHEVWRNKYISSPRTTNIPQPFAPLVSWDVSRNGKIICGYSEKYEIEIHDSDKGKISFFTHSYEPVKITEKDKKEFFSRIGSMRSVGDQIVERRKGADDFIIKNTVFPKFKPAFWNFIVDSEGNILVFTHRKNKEEMFRRFDAFDSEGNFITNVHVVGDVPFPASQGSSFIGRSIWTSKPGKDDLIKVIKYRISN